MDHWLGVDLGTSGVRALLLDGDGAVVGVEGRAYPVAAPSPGWAEQDPQQWWELTADAVAALLVRVGVRGDAVRGVGVTGQMHGLVLVDGAGLPARPAIIWPDRRSAAQVEQCTRALGAERVHAITGSGPATGMFGPSLAWVREHEPDVLRAASTAMLPKDHLRARFTGRHHTEPTDACGTLLYDVAAGDWSATMLAAFGVDPELLPPCVDPCAVVGEVTAAAAAATGLAAGTPVVAGAGDQATSALALGLDVPGATSVALSSGGTVVQVAPVHRPVPGGGVHRLCGIGGHLLMGATLNAGLALHWLAGAVLEVPADRRGAAVAELTASAAGITPGCDGLLFLPYLGGERTPHLDPAARGCFLGLTTAHGRAHLARAVMEGVAFALRDCFDAVAAAGSRPDAVTATGGGMRSPVWHQILADALGCRVGLVDVEEHSATGAAQLAARATGAGLARAARPTSVREPGEASGTAERLALFRAAHRATADLQHALGSG